MTGTGKSEKLTEILTGVTACKLTGMPVCDRCRERVRTNVDGSTLCPLDEADCPMVKFRGR